jgi:hypothetical protein
LHDKVRQSPKKAVSYRKVDCQNCQAERNHPETH